MKLHCGWPGLVLAASLGVQAQAAASPDLAQILSRHVQARGGYAALHAIRTLEMQGKLRIPGFDADIAYREVLARPGAARIEMTLQGLTPVQAYDGKSGWQVQPFQGRKDPEALSADDTKSLQEEADFESPLVDPGPKGVKLETLGVIDVDGGPTYAVRATLKNGDQQTYYIDPDAYLTVRVVTRQLVRGAETLNQTDYGDYEKVNGVYFPFEVDSGPKGSTQIQRVTYRSIVANGAVSQALFEPPKIGAAAPTQQLTSPATPEDQTVGGRSPAPSASPTDKPKAPPAAAKPPQA